MSADQKCQAPPPSLKSATRPPIGAVRMDLPRLPGYFQLTVRSAIAASLSFGIAQYLHLDHPIFAGIAAVIATDLTPARSRELGVVRLVATGVGAVCGLMLCFVLPSGPLAIGFGILVAMLVCQLFGAHDGAKVAGYISAIVILAEVDPWRHALLRCIETALGVGVAWLISYVPKLFPSRESAKEE